MNDALIKRGVVLAYACAATAIIWQGFTSTFLPGGLFYLGTAVCIMVAAHEIMKPVIEFFLPMILEQRGRNR